MKWFLDPVKNAKVVGIIIIISIVLRISWLWLTMKIFGISLGMILPILMVVLIPFAVWVWLIMHKKWAIYGLGILWLLWILLAIKNWFDGESLFWAIIYVLLFIRFWLARDRFGNHVSISQKNTSEN